MTVLISLTSVRYPPRDLVDRTPERAFRMPAGRLLTLLFALTWFPLGFWVASALTGGAQSLPAGSDSWLALAVLAPGGLPLALACAGLWRRGQGLAAVATLALFVPATAIGSQVVDPLGPLALVAFAALASLPAWLLYLYCRLFRQGPRRERRHT